MKEKTPKIPKTESKVWVKKMVVKSKTPKTAPVAVAVKQANNLVEIGRASCRERVSSPV